jgi:hypothetical protein
MIYLLTTHYSQAAIIFVDEVPKSSEAIGLFYISIEKELKTTLEKQKFINKTTQSFGQKLAIATNFIENRAEKVAHLALKRFFYVLTECFIHNFLHGKNKMLSAKKR